MFVRSKVDYPVGHSCLPAWNAPLQHGADQSQWERSLRAAVADLGSAGGGGTAAAMEEDRDYITPKLVTVIRNGSRPRKAVRILLNKKTAHSFDQVLSEITEAVKLDSGAVKKIFTVTGQQASVAHFFSGKHCINFVESRTVGIFVNSRGLTTANAGGGAKGQGVPLLQLGKRYFSTRALTRRRGGRPHDVFCRRRSEFGDAPLVKSKDSYFHRNRYNLCSPGAYRSWGFRVLTPLKICRRGQSMF